MSIKQAASIAVGLVVLAFLFAFVYLYVGGSQSEIMTETVNNMSSPSQTMAKKPVTADTATDAILSQADLDAAALGDAESDEVANVEDGSNSVNDLSNVYDDNEIQ